MKGEDAVALLREKRPGALYNEKLRLLSRGAAALHAGIELVTPACDIQRHLQQTIPNSARSSSGVFTLSV